MARQPSGREAISRRILDSALALAAEHPWRSVTMEMIAAHSEIPLDRLYALYPSRTALLKAFFRRIDEQVLKGHDPEDRDEPVRDRLLDVFLRRFDALGPHKEAVRSIARDMYTDPMAMLCLAPTMGNTMAWSLEAAGLSASGPMGFLRIKGLSAIYASAMRVWLRDETEDLSRTMAHLDRRLKQAEAFVRSCPSRISRSRDSIASEA